MDQQTKELIENNINTNEVCLFMKGTPDAPECGFSMAVANMLKILEVNFKSVNVLSDQSIREGIKKFSDLIGRSDLLNKFSVIKHWKAKSLDLSKLLYKPKVKNNTELYNSSQQEHDIVDVLDRKIIKKCKKIFNHFEII